MSKHFPWLCIFSAPVHQQGYPFSELPALHSIYSYGKKLTEQNRPRHRGVLLAFSQTLCVRKQKKSPRKWSEEGLTFVLCSFSSLI